jgi:hypothetical protein
MARNSIVQAVAVPNGLNTGLWTGLHGGCSYLLVCVGLSVFQQSKFIFKLDVLLPIIFIIPKANTSGTMTYIS